ncbi:HlyD family secretion protein [Parapedobacter tibetensis]|uniref:HlyD family secretion protein n=1 Tax=Parapedobacter tibetensis TaxID=2972951 RepID=UPI00214D6927|nr:HlyD family efflux transporter periplasmic adaptor subunit [Parapedobacter tibetensis]
MNRIFPTEIMEFTVENHFQQHHTRTKVVYQAVLLFLILGFVSLFFIRVAVSVGGEGIVRPIHERNMVKSPVSGRLENVLVTENQHVKAGTLLFTLEADILENQGGYASDRQRELRQRLGDLQQLVAVPMAEEPPPVSLATPLYEQQYHLFKQQLAEAQLELAQVQTRHDRQKSMYDKKMISNAEFDREVYELEKTRKQRHLLYDKQMSQWQTELNRLQLELRESVAQKQQLDKEKELYSVRAPVDGTIQNFNGVLPGSFAAIGETLAEISPDSGLVAEVRVSPKDIGLLAKGMPVRFQIDAFNYNQWGMVDGHIIDISDDVAVSQHQAPAFLVRCQLDKHVLYLPNGYAGKLKKGMSFRARFEVAERTLFQLLYDKADDWLNPNL